MTQNVRSQVSKENNHPEKSVLFSSSDTEQAQVYASEMLQSSRDVLEKQLAVLSRHMGNKIHGEQHTCSNEKQSIQASILGLLDFVDVAAIVLDAKGVVEANNCCAKTLLQEPLCNQSWQDLISRHFCLPEPSQLPYQGAHLKSGQALTIASTALFKEGGQIVLLSTKDKAPSLVKSSVKRPRVLTEEKQLSDCMGVLLAYARKVAKSDVSVLINGESGTGKEVFARYIHEHSPRGDKPFVAVNCAAIPESMLESMLFGHEKGAFTGAYQSHIGKFEQANGGTLLLDEVSEMPLALQAKLLRAIQEKQVERLGGKRTIQLDVRILATSNRDLNDAVKENNFREDLYYRLNVFPLFIPPLRQRQEDIIVMAEHFLYCYGENEKDSPVLSKAACQALQQHDWPGNIRELENVIQRALILSESQCIAPEDLVLGEVGQSLMCKRPENLREGQGLQGEELEQHKATDSTEELAPESLEENLKQREFDIILNTLQSLSGNRKLTAEKLGVSPRTLRYKLAEMRDLGYPVK